MVFQCLLAMCPQVELYLKPIGLKHKTELEIIQCINVVIVVLQSITTFVK